MGFMIECVFVVGNLMRCSWIEPMLSSSQKTKQKALYTGICMESSQESTKMV
uniref:Uncharacterized protein n=1 Tax=Arundo donax TaxID=35708 RepID=A0A0A9DV30_ARUDO